MMYSLPDPSVEPTCEMSIYNLIEDDRGFRYIVGRDSSGDARVSTQVMWIFNESDHLEKYVARTMSGRLYYLYGKPAEMASGGIYNLWIRYKLANRITGGVLIFNIMEAYNG